MWGVFPYSVSTGEMAFVPELWLYRHGKVRVATAMPVSGQGDWHHSKNTLFGVKKFESMFLIFFFKKKSICE